MRIIRQTSFLGTDRFPPAMTDVKNMYRFTFDHEQYAIKVRFLTVEQLTNLKGKACAFWS
jgi:hypothetical protein